MVKVIRFVTSVWWTIAMALSTGAIPDHKALQICSTTGGLDIVRLYGVHTRNYFQRAIDDVEFVREFISSNALGKEELYNSSDLLDRLASSLQWEARGFPENTTTLEAGLAYTDDSPNRRVDAFVGLANEPLVGDKGTDLAFVLPVANILPWIVDRMSPEHLWWSQDHQNGRSEGSEKPRFKFDQALYVAAWVGSFGEAWMYYPPITKLYQDPLLTVISIVGAYYDSHNEEFVRSNLPEHNPDRSAHFTRPYPDTAVPGLSLITAEAPIYFSGKFGGYTYNDTYIGSTGVDISVESLCLLLHELEGSLTTNSLAILVDSTTFEVIVISEDTMKKVYPERTGFEEERVTYSLANNEIIEDRRNQTYRVADTIFQPLTALSNANWTMLQQQISALQPGNRGTANIEITLTGSHFPTSFYAMFERWPDVADWALLVFAPILEVDHAAKVTINNTQDEALDVVKPGDSLVYSKTIVNEGTLALRLRMGHKPSWVSVQPDDSEFVLKPRQQRTIELAVNTQSLGLGKVSTLVSFEVEDDDYPDCTFSYELTTDIVFQVQGDLDLNQIDHVRPFGYAMATLACLSSLAWSLWTFFNSKHSVVLSSQPIFLYMMTFGTFVMSLSIFPLGVDDSISDAFGCDIACMAFPWLLSCGFCITFSALFSKVRRLHQIFEASKSFQRVRVTPRQVILPFLVLFSLNVVVLVVCTLADPMRWERRPLDDDPSNNASLGSCRTQSWIGRACLWSLTLLNFGALVLALSQIFRARGIPEKYQRETKYLIFAIGSMSQVFLTVLPILVLVRDSPSTAFVVEVTVIMVLSMSLVYLTFVPKFLVRHNPRAKRMLQSMSFDGEKVQNPSADILW